MLPALQFRESPSPSHFIYPHLFHSLLLSDPFLLHTKPQISLLYFLYTYAFCAATTTGDTPAGADA